MTKLSDQQITGSESHSVSKGQITASEQLGGEEMHTQRRHLEFYHE